MATLLKSFEAVPGAIWLLVTAAIAAVTALVSLVIAGLQLRAMERARDTVWRGQALFLPERSATRRACGLALFSLVAVPAATLLASERSRALIGAAIDESSQLDAGRRADSFAAGLSGALNAIPLGFLMLWGPSLLLGTISCALLLSAASARSELERPAPPLYPRSGAAPTRRLSWWAVTLVAVFMVLCGVAPMVMLATDYASKLMIGLGQASALPSGDKAAHILAALEAARGTFEAGYVAVLVAVGFVTAPAFVLLRAARGARDPANPAQPVGAPPLLASAGCLALSALLIFASAPYRAENLDPLPIETGSSAALPPSMRVHPPPGLRGSDPVELAPVLEIAAARCWLDGRPVDAATLESELGTLRHDWETSHPDAEFVGSLAIVCARDTSAARLEEMLVAAHRARYDRPQFVFGSWYEFSRPVIGKVRRPRFSAAEFVSVAQAEIAPVDGAVTIEASDHRSCDDVARAVAEVRRKGGDPWFHLQPVE